MTPNSNQPNLPKLPFELPPWMDLPQVAVTEADLEAYAKGTLNREREHAIRLAICSDPLLHRRLEELRERLFLGQTFIRPEEIFAPDPFEKVRRLAGRARAWAERQHEQVVAGLCVVGGHLSALPAFPATSRGITHSFASRSLVAPEDVAAHSVPGDPMTFVAQGVATIHASINPQMPHTIHLDVQANQPLSGPIRVAEREEDEHNPDRYFESARPQWHGELVQGRGSLQLPTDKPRIIALQLSDRGVKILLIVAESE